MREVKQRLTVAVHARTRCVCGLLLLASSRFLVKGGTRSRSAVLPVADKVWNATPPAAETDLARDL